MRMKFTITGVVELRPQDYPPLSRPDEILAIEEKNIRDADSLDDYLYDVDLQFKVEMVD